MVSSNSQWTAFKSREKDILGSTATTSDTLTVDGSIGPKTVTMLQSVLGTTEDGVISGQKSRNKAYFNSISSSACSWNGGKSQVVTALQKKLGITETGYLTKTTAKALQKYLIKAGYSCGSAGADGYFGTNSAKALQRWLNSN